MGKLTVEVAEDEAFRRAIASDGEKPMPTVNMLLRHGVQSCLEYHRSKDVRKRARSRIQDMGGHGYATVRVSADFLETEFVCIPRPLERSDRRDGGQLRYRVIHRARLWNKGERPRLEQRIVEGDPGLAI